MSTERGYQRWVASEDDALDAPIRLFCFAHAGAGTTLFQPWRQTLPPAIGLCPVRLPGRESRLAEPPLGSVAAIVDALAGGLAPLLDRPYALFGHCFGATIAFELARRLRELGRREAVRLLVSAEGAPHVATAPRYLVHAMPRHELVEHMRRLGGTDERILDEPELVDILEPAIRGDFLAAETYVHADGPPLAAPISAFAARDDALVPFDRVAAWQALTSSVFTLRLLPGDHMLTGRAWTQVAGAVATDVTADIDEACHLDHI